MANLLAYYLLNPGFVEALYDRLFELNPRSSPAVPPPASTGPASVATSPCRTGVEPRLPGLRQAGNERQYSTFTH